jgi:hypothetical protein
MATINIISHKTGTQTIYLNRAVTKVTGFVLIRGVKNPLAIKINDAARGIIIVGIDPLWPGTYVYQIYDGEIMVDSGTVVVSSTSPTPPSGSGHIIQDAGSDMPTENRLDFIGFTLNDNPGVATKVEMTSSDIIADLGYTPADNSDVLHPSTDILTSAEINTATDNIKYPTALGMAGSDLLYKTKQQQVTNKFINPRVSTSVSTATITPNCSLMDEYCVRALAVNLVIDADTYFGSSIPDGTWLRFSFTDDGVARTITWDPMYVDGLGKLPTTTIVGTTINVIVEYNPYITKYQCIYSGGGGAGSDTTAFHRDGDTVGAEKWLGTIDNYNLPFRTNNTERFAILDSGHINQIIGNYFYIAASKTADAVGDLRFYASGGNFVFEHCTVLNATKGAGTWVAITMGVTDHAALSNLSYATANHTGFLDNPASALIQAYLNLTVGRNGATAPLAGIVNWLDGNNPGTTIAMNYTQAYNLIKRFTTYDLGGGGTIAGNVAIDFANGGQQWGTTSNNVVFTAFNNFVSNVNVRIKINYGGAHTITFTPTINWSGGVAPTFTSVNAKSDWVTIVMDAQNKYHGFFSPNHANS